MIKNEVAVKDNANKTYTLLGSDNKFYKSEVPGTYGGFRKSKIYGRMDCPAALRAIAMGETASGSYAANRVFFADEQTAIEAGYRPCGSCLPKKYTIWKSQKDNITSHL